MSLSCGVQVWLCTDPLQLWNLSSWTREQIHVPCIGSQIRNHWATREVQLYHFLMRNYLLIWRWLVYNSHFSCAIFKILSTIWLLKCLGLSLFDLILRIHWTSWICRFISFITFGKILTIFSTIHFPLFSSHWNHRKARVGPTRMGPQSTLVSAHWSVLLSVFLTWAPLVAHQLQPLLSPASFNLLLNPRVNLLVIVLFSLRLCFLLMIFPYSHSPYYFWISFTSMCMFSMSSLSI